jgi:VanZ family protein
LFTDLNKHSKKFLFAALAFYWIILLLATSLPTESLPDLGGGDKIKHFSAYMILSVLLTLSLLVQERSRFLSKYAFIISVVIASVYGFFDEIHQMYIPGRSCEFLDWVADVGGAITGSLIIYIYHKLDRKYSKEGK